MTTTSSPDIILHNAKVSTLDPHVNEAEAIAITNGVVAAIGRNDDIMRLADSTTKIIDLGGKRVIPGLNDSHTHLIRGGLNYNMEMCPPLPMP